MSSFSILWSSAVTLAVVHTLIGVDHTVPFIMLGRARAWTLRRTLWVTALCGLGHVLSSVAVGSVGWALGVTASRLETFEAIRGNWAAWLLIGFGVTYTLVALLRFGRAPSHRHVHVHADGTVHSHDHAHVSAAGRVLHQHEHHAQRGSEVRRLVPALFVIFLLGPCEVLIPLMFAPAAAGNPWIPWVIALSFSLATIATMLLVVALGYSALTRTRVLARGVARLEPHMNWMAGVTIALSGVAVQFLGI